METKDLVLEKIKFGLRREIGTTTQSSLAMERYKSFITDNLIYKISGYVLGEKVIDEYIIELFPLNWWQHFKKDVLKSHGYKTRKVKVNIKEYRTYPSMNIIVPREWGEPIIQTVIAKKEE